MTTNRLAALILVLLVVLAGCSAINSSNESPTPTHQAQSSTTHAQSPTATSTSTPTSTATQTQIVKTPPPTATSTPKPEWSPPQTPNKPTEDKIEQGRISNGQIVDRNAATNGSGVSNFNISVTANTTMEDVDPPEHGDVEGEPYFLIRINDTLVERSDYFDPYQDESHETFNLTVRKKGLEQLDAGQLEVQVLLVDRDSEYDDVYGVWNETIEYNPD